MIDDRLRGALSACSTGWPALVAVPLACLLPMGAPETARGSCAHRHWVGAWGASPSDIDERLQNQTIRMVATPHVRGTRLRLRLTNRFGTEPIKVEDVRIARSSSQASIVPDTSRRVLWDGHRRVTIQPGRERLSDPVRLRVDAFSSLAISAYIPGEIRDVTRHFDAQQTSYVTRRGSGDHAADRGSSAFKEPTSSWLLVDGVQVSTRQRLGAVVTFGDSITDGIGSGTDNDRRYPDFLARRLLRRDGSSRISVLNAGISGNMVLGASFPEFGPSGLSRARADVIDQQGATDVVILEGFNDLNVFSAREVISGLRTLVHRFRRQGLHVLLGALTPAGATGRMEHRRRAVNRWILGRKPSRTIDFARVLRDPADPSQLAERFDSGDGLHPNAAGYRRMAAAVPVSRLRGGACR